MKPVLQLSVLILLAATAAAMADGDRPPASAKTTVVKIRNLKLQVPDSWKQVENRSSMRLATFEISGTESGDSPGELAIYSFRGGGGSVQANVRRWIGQFRSEGRQVKVTRGKAGSHEYVVVDVTGTWNQPVGPPVRRQTRPVAGSRMLAVILMLDSEVYYLKMTGPEAAIGAQAEALRASFGGDRESEQEDTSFS